MSKSKKRIFEKNLFDPESDDEDASSSTSEASDKLICVSDIESQESAKLIVNGIFDRIKQENVVDDIRLKKLIKLLQRNDTDFAISILLHFITLVSESTIIDKQTTEHYASVALVSTVLRNLEQVRAHACSINTILNKHIIATDEETERNTQNL
jgi:hypothetical protein